MILAMKEENEVAIWKNVNSVFREIIEIFINSDFISKFYEYASVVMKPIKTKVGLEPTLDESKY